MAGFVGVGPKAQMRFEGPSQAVPVSGDSESEAGKWKIECEMLRRFLMLAGQKRMCSEALES